MKNNRPVSNLTYLSEILEKVDAKHLLDHMAHNDLQEALQSAYKPAHSTETALLRVQNDFLQVIDKRQCGMLILLDLSAAFDTVDHSVLLQRLSDRLNVKGTALNQFESYLSDRTQSVVVSDESSHLVPLSCGIPQGSVLGPIRFTVIHCHLVTSSGGMRFTFICMLMTRSCTYSSNKPDLASSHQSLCFINVLQRFTCG